MAKLKAKQASVNNKLMDRKLLAIPLTVLLVKFILIANIQNHAWIGADGENYIGGLEGLLQSGYYSSNSLLSYWPAGYPVLMWIFGAMSRPDTLLIMATLQSIFYAFASLVFVREISKTNLARYSYWIAWILAINPTLSLSSMVIGYEIIPASIFLLAIALFINEFKEGNPSAVTKNSIIAAIMFSLSCYVQPRFLLTAAIFFILWAAFLKRKKIIPLFLLITLSITSVLPVTLALRNSQANGYGAISTNLGITMNLGAGPGASGKYEPEGKSGVPCTTIEGSAAAKDTHLVGCVIKWYSENPIESVPLLLRKAYYFWTPWFGPEVAGSMNRNPWFVNHPFQSLARNSTEGNNLVYGPFGKAISWIWIVSGLILIYMGFRKLWITGGIGRKIGTLSILTILVNWIISVGTLGDHRQRLPIMTLSLLLQCVGFSNLYNKEVKALKSNPSKTMNK